MWQPLLRDIFSRKHEVILDGIFFPFESLKLALLCPNAPGSVCFRDSGWLKQCMLCCQQCSTSARFSSVVCSEGGLCNGKNSPKVLGSWVHSALEYCWLHFGCPKNEQFFGREGQRSIKQLVSFVHFSSSCASVRLSGVQDLSMSS